MTRLRLALPLLAALALLPATPAFAAPRVLDGGEIIVEIPGGDTRAVAVTGDASLAGWAQKAIGMHGAFTVKAGAPLTMAFTHVGATGVKVTFSGSEDFSYTAQGADELDALWKALDVAIVAAGKKQNVKPLFATTKLAFTRELAAGHKEIYTGALMLPSALPVTRHGKISHAPRWSANGRALYYTTFFKAGAPEVYRIDIASGAFTPIANYKGTNVGGAASPDGSRIALALSAKGSMDIYLAGTDGRGLRPLVNTPDVETSPCWSPDGRRVAYVGGVSGKPQVFIIAASGGESRRVSSTNCTEPAWNPVQTNQIAYCTGDCAGIAVADINGGSKQVATKQGGGISSVSHPTWCADGRHLVVTIGAGKETKLGLLDAESGKFSVLSGVKFGNCSDPEAFVTK